MATYYQKEPTAYEKAQTAFQNANNSIRKAWDQFDKARANYATASKKYSDAEKKYKAEKNKTKKAKDKKMIDKLAKTKSSAYKAKDRATDNVNHWLPIWEDTMDKVRQFNAIRDKVAQQQQNAHDEGKAAIYESDGSNGTVIFISPSDTESESSSVDITSWPVDEGSPRSSHARTSSETKSIGGLITGNDRAEANAKYNQLVAWRDHHTTLTYEGSFYSENLLISELGQSFTNLRDNLKVTITFTLVRTASITTSTGKNNKKKKSKSSKTTKGNRNKNYTAITIKPGDTLSALSKKYGKSVSWLQKVNKIKNPNLIYAGNKLYVSQKQKKNAKKMRTK